jgi:hypothetical protein
MLLLLTLLMVPFPCPGITLAALYRGLNAAIELISELRMDHLAETAEDGQHDEYTPVATHANNSSQATWP